MFLLSLTLLHAPSAYAAEDDDEDSYLEEDDEDKGGRKKKTKSEKAVREIVRGVYGKANVGGALYILPPFSNAVSSGTLVSLAVGQDFVDNERSSMAWEIGLAQGLHNGADYYTQAQAGCGVGAPCTEGDLRTYTLMANYEYSAYVTRRFGVGIRAGAGVLYSPLLITREFWETEVLPEFGGVDYGYHNTIKPMFFGGPTFEYYTKLSHFSLGADVDVTYGIGWSLGVNASGSLKYTF